MSEAEAFFVSESVRHARTLPYPQMILFLRGMNFAIDRGPEYHPVRDLYISLQRCDAQMELIATGQLKLALPDHEATTKRRKGRS